MGLLERSGGAPCSNNAWPHRRRRPLLVGVQLRPAASQTSTLPRAEISLRRRDLLAHRRRSGNTDKVCAWQCTCQQCHNCTEAGGTIQLIHGQQGGRSQLGVSFRGQRRKLQQCRPSFALRRQALERRVRICGPQQLRRGAGKEP